MNITFNILHNMWHCWNEVCNWKE